MRTIRLAYRDDDRTPVIFCIKEMARRHYDVDIDVVKIKGTEDYEAALFDGACDVIIEHLEYLFDEAAKGRKITMFAAPSTGGGLQLVVPSGVEEVSDLRGGAMAVRSSGQPHAVTLWLRMMGLENDVKTVIVKDSEVGRWGQWKKVLSGECIAAFMSPLYIPEALKAGLKMLVVPDVPIVGHFAQACLSRFAEENPELLKDYVRAGIHAVCLMLLDRPHALEIVSKEPMKRLGISDRKELERQFDSIMSSLKARPYPTPQAIANSYEIATLDYPAAAGMNPMCLWNLRWVKELDDEGFIDGLVEKLSKKR
jgi:ABC-type nitrate/sulfonate/bicarbonate transport system substrate-binding protein